MGFHLLTFYHEGIGSSMVSETLPKGFAKSEKNCQKSQTGCIRRRNMLQWIHGNLCQIREEYEMKKLVAIILTVALLLCSVSAVAERMMVHIYALCYDTNHVGTDWAGNYYIGGYQIYDGDVVDLVVDSYDIYTIIFDGDRVPDFGEVTTSYKVTSSRLNKGFTVEQYLTVTEDNGMYKGYWNEWYVYYEFTPVGDYYVIN